MCLDATRRGRIRGAAPRIAVFYLVAALAVLGCSKEPADDELGSGLGSSEFDTGTGSNDTRGDLDEPERVRELASVYFDYDSSEVRADARPTLKSNAEAAQAHSEWRTLILEGHCDERGSEEYNLALGERRADSVKDYLVDLGIPSSRMQVVSFGSSAPAVQGHDESAWRWNRRVEFRVKR
jgi:peptidoglycan-associated lipoprotein